MAIILYEIIINAKKTIKKCYDITVMDKREKQINSKVVYDGKVIHVTKDDVMCPNGMTSLREIVHHRGGVTILYQVDNKFILERQFRYALDEEIIEMPAGKLEEGETPLEAAKRELLEETGYRPLEMVHLGDSYPTPGYSSEVIHLYYCPKAVKEERHLDKDENIDLLYLTLDEIEKLIADNTIKDSKTVAAIYLYKAKIKEKVDQCPPFLLYWSEAAFVSTTPWAEIVTW